MRVIIQRKGDGFFYRKPGEWTPLLNQSHDFKNSLDAILFCMEKQLSKVQVVLKDESSCGDVFLPAHEIPPFFMPHNAQ
jgi:hypothetical protein